MINNVLIFSIAFIIYFFLNLFFFEKLKNKFIFLIFLFFYLIISFIFFHFYLSEFVFLYLILLITIIISFKFYSSLFYATSPTLILYELILTNEKKTTKEIKTLFINKKFVENYLKKLIDSKFLSEKNDKLLITLRVKVFFYFFKYAYKFLF